MDSRQVMIVFQNALGHATKIAIHNSNGERVELKDVINMAKLIAGTVIELGNKAEGVK